MAFDVEKNTVFDSFLGTKRRGGGIESSCTIHGLLRNELPSGRLT